MKIPLSIVVGINPNFISNFDQVFENNLIFLKELGYTGIELALLRPEDIPVDKMNIYLKKHDMKVSALGTGSNYLRYGLSIASPDKKIQQLAIERVEMYCKFANQFEYRPKIILGLIRGRRLYNQTPELELKTFEDSLKILDEMSLKYETELIIEPINQFEIDLLHEMKDVVKILKDLNLKSTFTMIDSFHVWLEEDRNAFFNQLEELSSYVHHVHFAGPDRRAPKEGGIDYKRIMQTLLNKKYDGFFSIEAIAKPSFEYLAKESIKYLRNLL
jgi:D-psicose/D-tagatose/L-ribulose 3-epimerase